MSARFQRRPAKHGFCQARAEEPSTMIRALVALLGFAAAAVLLALAPDAGQLTGDELWYVAGMWAAAGLVAGVLYQAGGIRRPGMRLNVPLLVVAWLPWTLLS